MIEAPRIVHGDCLEILQTLKSESIDSCVTDPPYGFGDGQRGGFMGKQWDRDVPGSLIWQEVLRVLKPGGHLLSFFSTRTYHRGATAIEAAGFEIRDQIGYLYGSGFPKSLDVSKAIDKAAGAERTQVTGTKRGVRGADGTGHESAMPGKATGVAQIGINLDVTAPATEAAKQWEGWGTALKPAWEPIAVARKPLIGTVAANVLAHGTGALNVDGCRVGIGLDDALNKANWSISERTKYGSFADQNRIGEKVPMLNPAGRWPANIMHDGSQEVLGAFDGFGPGRARGNITPKDHGADYDATSYQFGGRESGRPGDAGTAARFFYSAKASKDDRNQGLHDFEHTAAADMVDRAPDSAGMQSPRAGAGRTSGAKNHHPTVKPVKLMRYLIRLCTPKGGLVLDPFAGSGSTLIAAYREDCRALGIEIDPGYFRLAEHRIDRATAQLRLPL